MKTILFFKSACPYFPCEQFIGDEIGYLADQTVAKVVLAGLNFGDLSFPVAEAAAKTVISLPMHPNTTNKQIAQIVGRL